jgi:hypothetical protein
MFVTVLGLGEGLPGPGPGPASDVVYQNYRKSNGPWSIHVVRVPRGRSFFPIQAVHAQGRAVGLSPLSDQVMLSGSARAITVAGVNGDFYQRTGPYAGDPRGLQIVGGELISAPAGSASLWIDAINEPHLSNTLSLLQVTWPDGRTSPMGLNGSRGPQEIELYTPAVGPSTHTAGGRELVLERLGQSPWLPLAPARLHHARIREVREAGDTPLEPGTMVLSVGPALAKTMPHFQTGAELILSTATSPSLRGARTAISGGPVLVREGKRQRLKMSVSDSYEFSSRLERHPRSAIGWNEEYYFLVEVDGRQKNYSVGMTLDELGSFLVELGCQDALNLDGGGSATLWYHGKVQNRPCDGIERPIANSVVVLKNRPDAVGHKEIRATSEGRLN